MSLLNNSPTFSYVRGTGISVIYKDKLYTVYDFETDKKFIYWNIETPSVFRASNIRPDTFDGQRIVLINENGTAIEVPNEDLKVFFDENSVENLKSRIFGLYEKNEEYEEKFIAIETDIDGISTTVGKLEQEDKKIKENISAINQRADEIDLSVKEVTKEFKDTELRDKLNGTLIKLASNLGIFKGEFTDYSKDNQINSDEKNKINIQINILEKSKNDVFSMLDNILKNLTEQGLTQEKTQIINAKNALNNAHTNLTNNMRNVISDGVITPTDRTLIIDAFAKYTLRINELKNVLDNVILLGMGGSIIEQFANINIKSDKIEQEVATVENGVKTNSTKIEQTSKEISLKANKNELISLINVSPEKIVISSSKIDLQGYVTFRNLSTPGQTVIDGGNIISNTITAEHIQGRHFLGVSVTTINDSGRARAVLTGDGVNFHSPYAHAGKLSYDSSGSGSSDNARDRLWLRSLGGYALKLQSSGDMSIEANGGYTNMWIKAKKIAFNIGSGGFWVNNKQIDFNNLKATATFG